MTLQAVPTPTAVNQPSYFDINEIYTKQSYYIHSNFLFKSKSQKKLLGKLVPSNNTESYNTQFKVWHLLEGELVWTWDGEVCVSASWLLQGLSQPDRRRDWRPRPRSVTPDGSLDNDISWEPGMASQFGKSILLLPTAARSDSVPKSSSQIKQERKEISVRQPQRTFFSIPSASLYRKDQSKTCQNPFW